MQVPPDFVPVLHAEYERRDLGAECVVWPAHMPVPTALDAVATVMLSVVDGTASIGDLVREVHEEVGVPLETAEQQVRRVVQQFAAAGILEGVEGPMPAIDAIAQREIFVAPPTPCSENASQLGMVAVNLTFGERSLRVACDSRRAARRLKHALADHLSDDEQPLGFVFNAPQGFTRTHRLTDRAGVLLSAGKGVESGLAALASHLTAFTPVPAGVVRIRARLLVGDDRAIICLPPLLYGAGLGTQELADVHLIEVPRLAVDLDTQSGHLVNTEIPWPELAGTGPEPNENGRLQTTVLNAAPPGTPQPTAAQMVAELAGNALNGSPASVLDACSLLIAESTIGGVDLSAEALLSRIQRR